MAERLRALDLPLGGGGVRLLANFEPGAAGGGPWLLALHGAGGEAGHWAPLLERLGEAGLAALAADLPGHGGSSPLPGEASVEAYAAWLGRLLEALAAAWPALGAPWLAGHSMGGAVAQEAALRFPERLAGLVLVATGARLRVAPALLEELEAGGWPPLLRAPEAEGGGGSAPGEGRLLRLREDLLACDRFDRRAEVAAIRLPTLVLQGGEDPLTPPRYGRFLAETIPGARLELVEGAGHFLQLEAPEACARAILAAVRPSPGASAARR